MKVQLSMILIAGLLLAADTPKEDAAKKDQDKLQGTWVVVAAERDGQPLDRIKGGKLIISGTNFTIHTQSGFELKGDYRRDPSKKPKTMDLTHTEGMLRDKTWQAIYHLEGDELKICYAEADSGKDRPTDFATAEGSGLLLTVLKREKP
jgi:uncharacterized protein (TIGR03067 family)